MAFVTSYLCAILFGVFINIYGHGPFAGRLFRTFIFTSHAFVSFYGDTAHIYRIIY